MSNTSLITGVSKRRNGLILHPREIEVTKGASWTLMMIFEVVIQLDEIRKGEGDREIRRPELFWLRGYPPYL